MKPRPDQPALWAALGEFTPVVGTMADYELASDLTGVYADPPPGLVIHYAGPIGEQVLSGSLWVSRQSASDFFARSAGRGLTELVHRLATPERKADISYDINEVLSVKTGPAAADFIDRPRGQAGGAVLLRTAADAPPATSRAGLILETLVPTANGTLLYEMLAEPPAEIPDQSQLIQLHSLIAFGPALDQLKRDNGPSA